MHWKSVSDPPEKATFDILLWERSNWVDGSYTKERGFEVYDGVTGEFYKDETVSHYLLIEPPSSENSDE
jgi:hypothetical protein